MKALKIIDNLLDKTSMTESKEDNNTKNNDKKSPKIILGTMEFGRFGLTHVKEDKKDKKIVTITKKFLESSHNELDTAWVYNKGASEECIGLMKDMYPNMQIATKVCPNYKTSKNETGLSKNGIIEQFNESLNRLKLPRVDILYLHWPDYKVDINITLDTINDLYKKGKFNKFGISNYSSWQVAQIYEICKAKGYVKPTVYQGMYNVLTRDVESELFKCLRYYGIRFYAYSPLAGGVLTGKHKYEDRDNNKIQTGRFKGNFMDKAYQGRFWKKEYFDCVDEVSKILKKEGNKISVAEASLMWIMQNSLLKSGDGVILSGGSLNHFEQNINALLSKEKLSDAVLQAFDDGWKKCKADCIVYYR